MVSGKPLSIIIPALDAAATLPGCLASLDEGGRRGMIGEVIVVDGGSRDGTPGLAHTLGARVLCTPAGRGAQLAAGAAAAVGGWLLFLHADTRLAPDWSASVAAFIDEPGHRERAGYFRLRFDDGGPAARRLERAVAFRSRQLALPYGDQGLLLSRAFYDALGGFRPLPLMEDVELVRRIGRSRLARLDATATTSAARYRRAGYALRVGRNLTCLALYFLGVPPRLIAKLYA
ncbi:MAG: TIGR04283 family arsenosugar biosynthesis glycosyltransferase [Alphaproteobacteria bacterium]|nr:TIGR04283 family arsenosugar biosynthesis glycosyltransferase [Alphaproteobacteria bacterium]